MLKPWERWLSVVAFILALLITSCTPKEPKIAPVPPGSWRAGPEGAI